VRLLDRFEHTRLMGLEDFMADYSDSRFGRFLLYLLVWNNKAKDWGEHGYRLVLRSTSVGRLSATVASHIPEEVSRR